MGAEFQDVASLQDFKSVDALAKGFVELKSFQGASIRIPGEDASDEARAEFNERLSNIDGVMVRPDLDNPDQSRDFYRSLGAPEKAEDYAINMPDGIENMQVDDSRIEMFRGLALEHGLTKKQFSGILGKIMDADLSEANTNRGTKEAAEATLRTEWGQAYDQNMTVAEAVARATGAPQEFQDAIAAGNMGPNMSKWLHSLASKFEGEGQNFINRDPAVYKDSPQETQEKINEIMNNKEHPYWSNGHPEHKNAIQKMIGLQQSLHKG